MDFKKFKRCLSVYLFDPEEVKKRFPSVPAKILAKNMHGRVEFYTYNLMPNHFHFQIRPRDVEAIPQLMKRLSNAYTSYFNKKYDRLGSLFQGRYKAAELAGDDLIMHVHRYIQINAPVAGLVRHPKDYKWFSYGEYAGTDKTGLCKTDDVLSRFSGFEDYKRFLLDQIDYGKSLKLMAKVLME